ncbi:MAG: NAD(P)-dependent oxidoreductase [Deltaproteobacteria bacterium]
MKKILITGATGFIGSFLVDEAQKRGYEIYAAVRKTSHFDHLENKNIKIVQVDFSDSDSLNHSVRSLPRFDYVIHNAGVTKSLIKDTFFEVNQRITNRLVTALLQRDKTPDKFLLMSSLAAFGPGDQESKLPVLLTARPKPVTAYGESKLAAEKFLMQQNSLTYIIIRPTAVYGPGEKDIFEIIKLMNHGIAFQAGTKSQCLTFIYVKDLARLIFDAIESPCSNKAYFATDGNLYTSRDLGQIVSRRLGRKIVHVALPVWLVKTMGALSELLCRIVGCAPVLNMEKVNELSARNWNCDVEPLLSELQFKAEYNLETGMNETIDWYLNERWLK